MTVMLKLWVFLNEDSKAEKAGLKIGDKICKVDGEDVTGWSISEVRNKIIGEVKYKRQSFRAA